MQENPRDWGALERPLGVGGVADPKIHTPPRRVTTSNLVVLRQSVYAHYTFTLCITLEISRWPKL